MKSYGVSNTKCWFWNRLSTGGAVVPASSSAGLEVAFTMRCVALMGMVKSEPFCHSKVLRFESPSRQTSVEPRPSTTR